MEQDKLQETRVQIVALDVRVTELETALQKAINLLLELSEIQKVVVDKVTKNG